MANIFTGNPMILDTVWTAGTIPAALTAQLNGNPHSFTKIIWKQITAAGDHLTITDSLSGKVLFDEIAPTAGSLVLWDDEQQRYTFKQSLWVLTVRDSGKLFLYK